MTLGLCRQLLLNEHWDEFAEKSLFFHPRKLAFELFEASLNHLPEELQFAPATKHAVMQHILNINPAEVMQAHSTSGLP